MTARAQLKLAGANLVELLPGDGQTSIAGRLTLDVTAEGTGLSPIALIGSLGGGGTFTFENGRLARLDPAAFAAVIRAIDQGLPIDATRVQRPHGCGARQRLAADHLGRRRDHRQRRADTPEQHHGARRQAPISR